jgi:membrane protein
MKYKGLKELWNILKISVGEFGDDRGVKLSASLAYYTIFSLAPLLLIIISVGGFFYGKADIQKEIFQQFREYLGDKAAIQIQDLISKTGLQHHSTIATILGVITLFIGASGIFAEIQDSINFIWGLKPKPQKGLMNFISNRLLSFSMILVLGFLLLVSLLLNAMLGAFLVKLKSIFPEKFVDAFFYIDYVLMFVVIILLFASIFKVLPDARIKWKDVLIGAIATSVLFVLGKFLIGFYLQYFGNISAYGAAGSLIVILLWVYYTSIILYFGAEFTQVFVREKGRFIEPNKYAVWVDDKWNKKVEEGKKDERKGK